MANAKISQLASGNPAQSGDLIPIDRGGANFSLSAASVAALAAGASSLAISSAAAPATVNLTTEGTNDWLITNGQSFSGGQPAINGSTFFWKKKGDGFVIQRSFVGYWSSIAPAGSAGSSGSGVAFTATAGDAVYCAGAGSASPPPTSMSAYLQLSASPTAGGGYGYQFAVPSNSVSRTLKLYMTVQGILNPNQALVTAHMSDGSIADQSLTVTDTGTGGIGTAYMITITYKSASPCPMVVNVELSGANIGAVTFLGLTIA
jgi:hypothetical protein